MAGGIVARPRGADRLTDRAIRAFLTSARAGNAGNAPKLWDGYGLFLLVTPAGTPCWRWKYRVGKAERLDALGIYPAVTLAAARVERDRRRALVSDLVEQGKDPAIERLVERERQATRQGERFATVAREWIAAKRPGWSPSHYDKTVQAFDRDVFGAIGELPIDTITAPMITHILDAVQRRTHEGQHVRETAARIRLNISRVFGWAIARGRCSANPTPAPDAVLRPKPGVKPQPALLTFPELGDVLRRAERAPMLPALRIAHRLVAFTAARMNNIVKAKWNDFDLDGDTPTWVIPRAEMKVGEGKPDHRIPLGPTLVRELRAWRQNGGGRGFVCGSAVSTYGHVRIDSLDKAYREGLDLRGRHVPHGWRASFRTLASAAGFDPDAIELFLDHEIQASAVVRAYERGTKWEARVQLAYWWDGELTAAQQGGEPLRLKGVA